MFGSCDWPWLSKAWTRLNNNNNNHYGNKINRSRRWHIHHKQPSSPIVLLLLILAIATLVPPTDVLAQTSNTLPVASYVEIEGNDSNNAGGGQQPEQQPPSSTTPNHSHHPQLPLANKMVDGGAVSKVGWFGIWGGREERDTSS